MEGKYIYGIINSNDEATLAITGLGGSRPAHTIAHKDLACVVSDYSGREAGSMSREEVVRSLLAHQTVVEHVMREHTVLPLKFGTVLATPDEVRDFLSAAHQQFADALAGIEGKVEVEVAATWDTAQVLREISAEPEIVRAKGAIARRPGEETLEERIRLGQMAKAAMDRRRDSYRERMIDSLKPVAIDVQPNALVSDQMVMNVAFLVEKARQDEFDARVRQLNELFHEQIDFRIIGPLP
ncbi:MAG: GvpL/GvpF family gas vesicle protein, partial [Chloroflexota bacterium]